MGGWVKPQLGFSFRGKFCVFSCFLFCFYVLKCFQKKEKMDNGVGGCSFSRIFGFCLIWQDPKDETRLQIFSGIEPWSLGNDEWNDHINILLLLTFIYWSKRFKGLECAVPFLALCTTKNTWSHLIRVGHIVPTLGFLLLRYCHDYAEGDIKQYSRFTLIISSEILITKIKLQERAKGYRYGVFAIFCPRL